MENAQNNIVKFEVGKSYYYRFACNTDTVVTVTVIKRTAKTITIDDDGEKLTRKIYILDGSEHVAIAHYSMAPTLDATRTQESLEAVTKAAEEKRAEEERKEEEERAEAHEESKTIAENTIETFTKAFPLADGAAFVEVSYSEFYGLYDVIDEGKARWSVAAADKILGAIDNWVHKTRETSKYIGHYYKTDFAIKWTENGEECAYYGRYDLGDGEGGLLNHIRNFGEWNRTHEEWGKVRENPPETNEILEMVKKFESFAA